MKKLTKLICGYGYVGKSMHRMFPESFIYDNNDLLVYDKEKNNKKVYSGKFDACFVCVPTPMMEDGSCDTSIVENVVSKFDADLFIIRSTIGPGTTNKLNQLKPCVFQPVYISGKIDFRTISGYETSNIDELEIPFVVFGGPEKLTDKAISIYQEVYNASTRFYQFTGLEAEIIKYMENSAIGTMVTFCNTFYEICKIFGLSYNKIREGFLADPRMSRFFTLVYENQRGFGGKCIPKDMSAIYKASVERGYSAPLIRSILDINQDFINLQD